MRDDVRECAALHLAHAGRFEKARQAAQAIGGEQARGNAQWAVSILEGMAERRGQARRAGESLLGMGQQLRGLSGEVMSALVSRLSYAGAYGLARRLVASIPASSEDTWESGRERPALVLVEAATRSRQGVLPEQLVEVIETELEGENAIAGLEWIGRWVADVYRQERALGPVFQAVQTARGRGHTAVLLHIAGLAPLLDDLGGARLVGEALLWLRQVEEWWEGGA